MCTNLSLHAIIESIMKVFKFGGASINSVDRIKNLSILVKEYSRENMVIIISAMGKTTNALEKVAEAFYANKKEEALLLFDAVKKQHFTTAKYLLVLNFNECIAQLNDFFTEVEWLLHDKPVREFDYYYDQIVCSGELMSTAIISHYLNETGIANKWIDVRDLIKTDNNFRDAVIDFTETTLKIKAAIAAKNIYITQGFIGCTDENESTTLGREGSDYTAAVFANILDAENITIWKDVEGVMNADPKEFTNATVINELSFNEIIEMAYYGAQVIHPKTIKPLQNKGIKLFVKCFLNPSLPGTVIHQKQTNSLPPIIVNKQNQVLIHLHSQDFSFVGEKPMAQLYEIFSQLKLKPNLIQTGAISVQICMDNKLDKTDLFAATAAAFFDVQMEKGLSLLTIRHYTHEIKEQLLQNKNVVLEQRTKTTLQVLYK
jgi:aspartate kinase